MSLTRKIAHNTLYQLIGKGISSFLGLIAIAFLTRYLGREGFGQYTTVLTFLQIFGILIDFGLTLVTIQMISEPGRDRNKTLSNLFSLRLISAVFFFGLAPLIALLLPYSSIVKIGIAITAFAFLLHIVSQILVGLFQKELRTEFIALGEIFNRIVFLVLIVLFVFFKMSLLWFLFGNVVAQLVNFGVLYVFSRKLARISFGFDWLIWKDVWRRSYPLAITIVLNLVYLRADIFLLSILRSQGEVGLYGAPYKIIDALVAFIFVFVGMILGPLSGSWARNEAERFKRIVQRSLDALMAMAFPLVLGGMVLAKPIMLLIAGEDFGASGDIFKVLLIALWWIFFGTLFTHVVIAVKKQHKIIWGFAINAILSLIGYIIFIPRYSYWGAAGVTIFSEVFIAVWAYVLIRKVSGYKISFDIPLRAFLASLVMVGFLYLFPYKFLFLQIGLGAVVYAAMLYLLGGYNKQMIKDILLFRQKS